MKIRSFRNLGPRALLIGLLAAGPAPAMADAVPGMYWTHVGSTGTVTTADLPAALFGPDTLTNVGPAAGTVHARYNVVAVDSLTGFGGILVVRYHDQGTLSQVVARLWEVSIETGAVTLLAEFDSDRFPPRPSFQTQQLELCNFSFDFTRNAYYVGVQLIRSTTPGTLPGRPALSALQIKPSENCLH